MGKIYAHHSGSWKQVKRIWVKNNSNWDDLKSGLINSSGVGKMFYPDAIGTQSWTTPGSHSYTVPNGVTQLVVNTFGGGGGGQQGWGNTNPDGGGAGGEKSTKTSITISVTPGQSLTAVVGSGGSGGSNSTSFPCGGGTSPDGHAGNIFLDLVQAILMGGVGLQSV
jgi:hypothetical protein